MRSLTRSSHPRASAAAAITTTYFPPEIWQAIGQYLSKRTLRKIRHLSSVFYQLYLKSQYGAVYINWNERSKKQFDFLSLFHKYVHHLVIDAFVVGYELLAAPSLITNLHSLTLKLPAGEKLETGGWVKRKAQFYSSLWRTIGPNLKHLGLYGFSPNHSIYLPSPSLLPSLKRLTFDDQCEWTNSIVDTAGDKKVQLICGLAPQLRVLDIDFPLSRVAPTVPVFRSLEQLSIRICVFRAQELGLNLIVGHKGRRRPLQLHLAIEGRDYYCTERIARFVSELNSTQQYVELRSLKFVDVPWHRNVTNPLRELIPLCYSTLRNLDLGQTDWAPNEMYLPEFVTTVSTYGQLSSLSLNIHTLDLGWLIFLSSKFPNIDSLCLYVHNIDWEVRRFVDTPIHLESSLMQNLRAWKLYELGIYHDRKRLDNESMNLIVKLIPSVESFWGEDCIEPNVEYEFEHSVTRKAVWQSSFRAVWRSLSYWSFAFKASLRGRRKEHTDVGY